MTIFSSIRPSTLHLLFATTAVALGCGSGGDAHPQTGAPSAAAQTALTVEREVVVDFDVPAGAALGDFAIVSGGLQIDTAAKVMSASGKFGGVAHVGADAVRVGRDVELGTLVSVGDVAIGDGVSFHGDLRTAGAISAPPPVRYTVEGTTTAGTSIALRKLSRRAQFGATQPAIRLGPSAPSMIAAPGAYASARVLPGSELVLRAGNYYFDELEIAPGATLTIDDRNGSVFVYVGKDVRLNGAIAHSTKGHPRWLLSYLGSTPVILSQPFVGGLLASNASVSIAATTAPHQGSFYAKAVHVAAGARVIQRTMPWVITSVTFDKANACSGDTVALKVNAPDPTNPAVSAAVTIDGAPIDEFYDQILTAPGEKLFAVSAVAADGTHDSQIARLPVVPCTSGQSLRPVLVAQANPLVPETVALTVMNAPDLGDVTYLWDFGDGGTVSGPSASVSHTFVDSVPKGSQYAKFNVTVTAKRTGSADVAAKRTFVVWSSYEMSRARGVLEPPTTAVDPLLRATTTGFSAEVDFTNREAELLTYTQRRIDVVPCDGDSAVTTGGDESISVGVPAKGSLRVPLTIPATSLSDKSCGVIVHYFGQTASGTKAHVSVPLDRASKPGKGVPVDATTTAMLQYLVKNGDLVAGKRVTAAQLVDLYQARRIPKSALTTTLSGSGEGLVPREPCDPEDPGPPPMPGFSCQPTGKWEGAGEGTPLDDRIQNAFKGDSVLVRSCGGMLAPLLGSLRPAQLFTHTGIMTKHRSQIAHSTGSVEYLMNKQANGSGDMPTDGFKESGLRYLWPGTIVASVREAFVTGRELTTPEGEKLRVGNFTRNEVRCTGDTQVVFPRVLKPNPIFESSIRPKLMAAADAAKTIHGHYRFASYSNAPVTPDEDPKGPEPISTISPLGPSTGKVPTVCSSFVRFSLKKAGFTLDADKGFPMLSDDRGGAADGLFFYDADERKAAANELYAGLYNEVQYSLALLTAKTDNYWWKEVVEPDASAMGFIGLLCPAGTTGTVLKWATDAPDDVASQITNCFASDFCSEDAKDSDAWENPGTGIAVSPDDMLNHFDSPRNGGPYGHSERMIYRGPDFRPVYEWRPIDGTLGVKVHVVYGGKDAENALVTIPGFLTDPVPTDAKGYVLIEGVPRGNLLFHAQKMMTEPAPGKLFEANACYVPADKTSSQLLLVDCKDFTKVLNPTPVGEVTIVLQPPREEFRKVIISALPRLEDCDCGEPNDIKTHSIFEICNVSPLSRVDSVSRSAKELCSDEVGVSFDATCTLQSDDRTVRITGTFKLFEDAADTCGADDKEDEKSFDVKVGPGVTTKVPLDVLYNYDVCGLADCNDTANINDFTISNQVD